MTRLPIVFLLALSLAACRTEPTDAADADSEAAATADSTVEAGGLPYIPPRRTGDAEQSTRTAMLREVVADGEECFVMAEDSEGDLLLMGTAEACQAGAALAGQTVILTQETAALDVPLGDETSEQDVELVVGIERAE